MTLVMHRQPFRLDVPGDRVCCRRERGKKGDSGVVTRLPVLDSSEEKLSWDGLKRLRWSRGQFVSHHVI